MGSLALALGRIPGLRRRRVRLWLVLVSLLAGALLLEAFTPGRLFLPPLVQETGPLVVLVILLLAICCEFMDSSLGMGYGTTLTPILLLLGFRPLDIVPAVLFSELLTGLTATLWHHKDGNVNLLRDPMARQTALLLSLLSGVGAIIAVSVAIRLPQAWLGGIIAVIILSVGVVVLATSRTQLRYRRGHIIGIGAIAAFNKGLSGGGYGPLVCAGQVVSGVSPKQAVAITSLAEAVTCAVGLGAYVYMRGTIHWGLAIPLAMGGLLSVPMATLTVRRLPAAVMRKAVGIATCVLGVLAIVRLLT